MYPKAKEYPVNNTRFDIISGAAYYLFYNNKHINKFNFTL